MTATSPKPEKVVVQLDFDNLVLGDLELFEEATGQNLFEAIEPQIVRDENGRPVKDPDDPKGRPLRQMRVTSRTMVALVYIAKKKTDPTVTLDEVKAIPLNRLDFQMANVPEGDDEADPTEPPESEQDSEPTD